MAGVQTQPCCCTRFQPCGRCNNNQGPLYFQVVLTGIADKNPADCPACTHYNSAVFTLRPVSSVIDGPTFCYSSVGGHLSDDFTPCCWVCFIQTSNMECLFPPGAPNVIALKIAAEYSGGSPTGNYILVVELDDTTAGRHIRFEKSYASLPDCRSFASESIPWSLNGSNGRCSGSGSSTCLITAVSSVSDPCCRSSCYPNQTPGPVTVVVTNIQDIGCGSCSSLNATYVASRQVEADAAGHCYIARFAETCGFDSLAIIFGGAAPIGKFFHSSTPSGGDEIVFNICEDSYSTPYAACNQFNGAEIRATGSVTSVCRAGDGNAYNAADAATYAKMVLSF